MARLLTRLSAAAPATTGIALAGPAHAVSTQGFLSYVDGWRVGQHVRELADVNGDGRADVVAFGDPGVFVAYGQANGTFAAPVLTVRDFGTAQGWRTDRHPRQVADVDGAGRADLVGFGHSGTYVSCFSAPGDTFTQPVLEIRDLGYAQGWRVDRHPRDVCNVNGSGPADVVGFGHRGVLAACSRPSAPGEPKYLQVSPELADFGTALGWRTDRHPRDLADLDGDGVLDVVGFGNAGVHVA